MLKGIIEACSIREPKECDVAGDLQKEKAKHKEKFWAQVTRVIGADFLNTPWVRARHLLFSLSNLLTFYPLFHTQDKSELEKLLDDFQKRFISNTKTNESTSEFVRFMKEKLSSPIETKRSLLANWLKYADKGNYFSY